ncbi:MAG: hypothetical protein CL424_12880, partial [Acidimicrobiaceae bacterium]|nr:hypothetical protein [Acidimicrobiaceae bacterium]
AELNNTNQLTTDEMTVDTDASHTTPRHLTTGGSASCTSGPTVAVMHPVITRDHVAGRQIVTKLAAKAVQNRV